MANLNNSKIKSLQVQITKFQEEIKNYNLQLQDIQLDIATKQQQIKKYQDELKKLKSSKEIIISEHAILRYIERVMKIDMEKLQNEVISKDFQTTLKNLGNGTYPHKNHLLKIVDNVVVTIMANDEQSKTVPKKAQIKSKSSYKRVITSS